MWRLLTKTDLYCLARPFKHCIVFKVRCLWVQTVQCKALFYSALRLCRTGAVSSVSPWLTLIKQACWGRTDCSPKADTKSCISNQYEPPCIISHRHAGYGWGSGLFALPPGVCGPRVFTERGQWESMEGKSVASSQGHVLAWKIIPSYCLQENTCNIFSLCRLNWL